MKEFSDQHLVELVRERGNRVVPMANWLSVIKAALMDWPIHW